jgi:gliding motility-associated-like protein
VCVTLCDRAGACTKFLIPLTITPCADNTPPTINCPSPIEISTVGTILNDPSGFIRLAMLADNCNGVNLDFKLPTAIDDCSSTPIVRQTGGLLSGGTFAKGSNILSFEALDKTGKKSTCRVEITVSPIQLLETDKATACLNETVHIQGKLIPKAAYAWKGPQNLTSDNPSLDFTFTNTNQSGPYILSATLGKNCVFKDTITITVNNAPKVVNDSFAVEINGTLTENVLKNDSVKNGIIYTLTTRDNAVNGSVILKNDGTITYKPTTDYTGVDKFTYEVCSELCPNICQKGTVVLTVASPFKQVYSANEVITPNGDNFNEALIIEGLNVHNPKNNSSIAIYSQWGELVYTAAPYMNNWKGTHKDLPLPDGTYYYIFKADPKSEALKSFITIFR